jgi:hypothetical protein
MPFDTAKEKLARIDSLIKRRATGSPEHLSRTLGICRATWFNWLEQLKALGLPIAYDPDAQTYYYTRPGRPVFMRWDEPAGGGVTIPVEKFFAIKKAILNQLD